MVTRYIMYNVKYKHTSKLYSRSKNLFLLTILFCRAQTIYRNPFHGANIKIEAKKRKSKKRYNPSVSATATALLYKLSLSVSSVLRRRQYEAI